MHRKRLRSWCALTALVAGLSPALAKAQWGPPAFGCSCTPAVATPHICPQPVAPVVCYRPKVTTQWQPVEQTVRRPVVRTEYVEREVTVMEPVQETKIVKVPQITYQTITECKTVQRTVGYWRTCFQPVPKPSPCQYDSRPGLIGFLNRTSVAIRNALTPPVIARPEYVAQPIVQTIPVTRQVAVQTMQDVVVHETKYRAVKRREKVAVPKVEWREEKVIAYKPVTVVQQVPVGTTTAFGFWPYSYTAPAPQTVLAPATDPISQAPARRESRSRSADAAEKVHRSAGDGAAATDTNVPARRSSFRATANHETAHQGLIGWRVRTSRHGVSSDPDVQLAAGPGKGRHRGTEDTSRQPLRRWRPVAAGNGPRLVGSALQLASNTR
ncbi:MAG: hypothetical protein D6725_13420 [Planctomycetota bacterium]|nr:MAG: hypothetical protein D6725_13420 [Planctomycetota bacterium]